MSKSAMKHARIRRLPRLGAAAVLAAMLSTGCAIEEPGEVLDEAEGSVVVEKSGKSGDSADDGEKDMPETAGLGDTVAIGSWEVEVTSVVLNANDTIARANMFNDKPRGQFVLATYTATYVGEERTADAWADLSWSFTTTDQRIHDEAMAVTPADNQSWPTEARRGGTVKHQVVFDLKPGLVSGGLLTVEGYDESFDTTYADFKVS